MTHVPLGLKPDQVCQVFQYHTGMVYEVGKPCMLRPPYPPKDPEKDETEYSISGKDMHIGKVVFHNVGGEECLDQCPVEDTDNGVPHPDPICTLIHSSSPPFYIIGL